ncbi:hypothetical protein BDR05DRAFT_970689 [Suillus weaverae]|nr:hypothetical protein BDR05DRAFT_970689 [Suillus weaverae]
MSPPAVADLSKDVHSSKSPPVPTGWSAELIDPKIVQTMLQYSTGLTGTIELAEDQGPRYIFLSGKDYYIWNTTSEEGWRILNVKNRDELYSNVAKGKGGLKLEELPDYGDNLEG